jgi:hypothetical protein
MREEAQHGMADELHTIRFKREGVEFELTGSREEVTRAWESLKPAVVTAFEQATSNGSTRPSTTENGDVESGEGKAKKRRRKTGGQQRRAATSSERADVEKKLTETPLDGFAQIGSDPSARIAGYAALDWARTKADTDGLTAQEIQRFLSSRLRIKNTYQAYAAALGGRVKSGEIDKVGNLFKLMGKGEDALAEHVKKVAKDEKGG